MLEELKEFRDKLDNLMCSCMDKTIVIYGYGYSGRFVAWYADYYHSIKPRYLITEENSSIYHMNILYLEIHYLNLIIKMLKMLLYGYVQRKQKR